MIQLSGVCLTALSFPGAVQYSVFHQMCVCVCVFTFSFLMLSVEMIRMGLVVRNIPSLLPAASSVPQSSWRCWEQATFWARNGASIWKHHPSQKAYAEIGHEIRKKDTFSIFSRMQSGWAGLSWVTVLPSYKLLIAWSRFTSHKTLLTSRRTTRQNSYRVFPTWMISGLIVVKLTNIILHLITLWSFFIVLRAVLF